MSNPTPDPPDDLDALLTPPPGAVPSADLRDAIFRQTGRALARAQLVRRVVGVGSVAAVFAAGGLAGWVGKPERVRVELVAAPAEVVVVPVVVPVPAAPPTTPAPSPPEMPPRVEPMSASTAELRAEQLDDPAEAARLYRLAGDKYLNDGQDYRNAARCYRLFLTRTGDPGLSPEPGDTWLLTSLKNAAFKEKRDVAKTDG
ncbi:MAG: hypothetical protein JWO38_774 [Gemmataceae bacterium]|nr:hypothetical protein [Gemmataceae bacterium]